MKRYWIGLGLWLLVITVHVQASESTAPAESGSVVTASGSQGTHLSVDALSPLGMYQAADPIVKAVMLILLAASGVTWAVLVTKQWQLGRARRRLAPLVSLCAHAESFAAAKAAASCHQGTGLAFLSAAQTELALSEQVDAVSQGVKERVQARLERVQVAQASMMNRGTGVLASIGSVAPFVGLFGTVWGIMNAFIGIAHTQTTNLAVVAPGIAEALLATALGLVAAIPAVIVYNYFTRALAAYRAQMGDLAVAILVLVSRDLDSERNAQTELAWRQAG